MHAWISFPVTTHEKLKELLFEIKVSLYDDPTRKDKYLIKPEKIVEFDSNFVDVLNTDFEYNGEPYYEAYDFTPLKIQAPDRFIALAIVDERYCMHLHLLMKENKGLKEDLIITLNNCSVYQLKKNEVVVKPGDVGYINI